MLISFIACTIGAFLISAFSLAAIWELTQDKATKYFFALLLFLICLLSFGAGMFGAKDAHEQTATEAQKEAQKTERQILSDSLEILKMKNEIKTLNEGK